MIFPFLIKKGETAASPAARERVGKFSGILGIALNTLLAAGKIAVGALTGMISVLADGMNNLTDCGSNVVSVIGFKVSGKPADKEHPFGHQRAETIAALVIAVVVLAVAAELVIQSIETILSPSESEFSVWAAAVLAVSVAVKLFMFFANRSLSKAIGSDALAATATDSISDAVATSAVLACLFISRYTGAQLDGYVGAAVAVFIAFSGFSILKETVSRLLGRAVDADTADTLRARVCSFAGVHGVHDLTVHEYGNNKKYATVHVEVDANMPLMATHDLADTIEKEIGRETGVELTVHIDPLVLDDPKVNALREAAEQIAAGIDPALRVHDFRVVGGTTHANLVFEVAAPFDCPVSDGEILAHLRQGVQKISANLGVNAAVERQNLA